MKRNGTRVMPAGCPLVGDRKKMRGRGSRRSVVISLNRLRRSDTRVAKLLYPETCFWRPIVRADCGVVPRPCPYVGCQYHLFLDVTRTGIRLNFPGHEVWEIPISCALDLAEAGPKTLEEIGNVFNMTRERVRQIEQRALRKLSGGGNCEELIDQSRDLDMSRPDGHPLWRSTRK